MTDNQYELVQYCIDNGEFVTVKLSNHYLLIHQNVLNNQSDLGNLFFRSYYSDLI